jgi:hypothetical protein
MKVARVSGDPVLLVCLLSIFLLMWAVGLVVPGEGQRSEGAAPPDLSGRNVDFCMDCGERLLDGLRPIEIRLPRDPRLSSDPRAEWKCRVDVEGRIAGAGEAAREPRAVGRCRVTVEMGDPNVFEWRPGKGDTQPGDCMLTALLSRKLSAPTSFRMFCGSRNMDDVICSSFLILIPCEFI